LAVGSRARPRRGIREVMGMGERSATKLTRFQKPVARQREVWTIRLALGGRERPRRETREATGMRKEAQLSTTKLTRFQKPVPRRR